MLTASTIVEWARRIRRTLSCCLLPTACCLTAPAAAQPFYEGKTINIIVGFTPGGGYDQLARFAARNLPRFLAGKPTIEIGRAHV